MPPRNSSGSKSNEGSKLIGKLLFLFIMMLAYPQIVAGSPTHPNLMWMYGAIVLAILASIYLQLRGLFKTGAKAKEISAMNPYEFEYYVANLFQRMGYSARVTAKSDGYEGGDYGADIIAKKDGQTTVVQVKKWAPHNLVGAPDVRSTLGCMHTFGASKAILVTTSDFTEQARIQAKGAPIELWNWTYLRQLLAKYS